MSQIVGGCRRWSRAIHAAVSLSVIPAKAGIQVPSPPASGCRIKSGMTGECFDFAPPGLRSARTG